MAKYVTRSLPSTKYQIKVFNKEKEEIEIYEMAMAGMPKEKYPKKYIRETAPTLIYLGETHEVVYTKYRATVSAFMSIAEIVPDGEPDGDSEEEEN